IKIEISVLTVPQRSNVNDIELSRHGVMIKNGFNSGVFLPQVATETGWTKEQFLSELCFQKAGLNQDCYMDPETEIYTFEAQVFSEI
ncbi:MAG: AMMECR1 domain-containing protein, partial [Patescibacteria group bacterium]